MRAPETVLALLLVGTALAAAPAPAAKRPPGPPPDWRPPNGTTKLTFTERSPASEFQELCRRLNIRPGATDVGRDKPVADYNVADAEFHVCVPPKYKDGVPHGVIVWMGVSEFSNQYMPLLGRHMLIFVQANPGRTMTHLRAGYALDAVHNLKQRYTIDESRVYVAGFSAGAGMATFMVAAWPEVFSGGLFMMGGTFYAPAKDEAGKYYPTVMRIMPEWHGPLDEIKRNTSLVLMRGERDKTYTAPEGRAQFEGLQLDGFERASFIYVPGVAHYHPTVPYFDKALVALDRPRPKKPLPTTAPTSQPSPGPAQVAQAKRLLGTALLLLYGRDGKPVSGNRKWLEESTRPYLRRVIDDYPTTPSAARAREELKKLDAIRDGRAPTTAPTTGSSPPTAETPAASSPSPRR